MNSLDTNIVLRLLLHDILDQTKRIIGLIKNSKPRSLMVADAVFFECVWILAGKIYKFDRVLIGELLLQVANIPQINCNRALLEKAVPLYIENPNISFIDACLATYAELNSAAPLLTFDRKLVRALPEAINLL